MPSLSAVALPCPRCHGLVLNDFGDVRCMNCGCRPCIVLREPEEDPRGRRSACSNCKAERKDGHNYCQRHLDYFRSYKLRKKDAPVAHTADAR